jgi:hypothetical protein
MDYLTRIWLAPKSKPLTATDVAQDPRIIGKYAYPPMGIRQQRNSKRLPDDQTGEPHADGLIAGGAIADVLVGMCQKPGLELEDLIKAFAKINLNALALMPLHKVTFRDMLRALILADQLETNGDNRQLIEKSFAKHGITLGWHGIKPMPPQLALAA